MDADSDYDDYSILTSLTNEGGEDIGRIIDDYEDDNDMEKSAGVADDTIDSKSESVASFARRRQREALLYKSYLSFVNRIGEDGKNEDDEEHAEQLAAQIAVLSCEISEAAIRKATIGAIQEWRTHAKTRYDMNQLKTREFRYGKSSDNSKDTVAKSIDNLADEFERYGKANYAGIENYPSPYVRDYQYKAFQSTLKALHPKQKNFKVLEIVDLAGQLIGDDRLAQLCNGFIRCPITTLILSGNDISNGGCDSLSRVLRSFRHLEVLNLSNNEITDEGVARLLHDDAYSPTLKTLHLSRNPIGCKSAYYIGKMFEQKKVPVLQQLYLGGKVGKVGFGSEFLRILIGLLCAPFARDITLLHYGEAGLEDEEVTPIAALIACSSTITDINISKNSLVSVIARTHLINALRVNRSLKKLQIRQCGLTRTERDLITVAMSYSNSMQWPEKTLVAYLTAKELDSCTKSVDAMESIVSTQWIALKPIPWPTKLHTLGYFSNTDGSLLDSYMTVDKQQLLPVEINSSIVCLRKLMSRVDYLLLACDAADEYLAESTEKLLLQGSATVDDINGINKVVFQCDKTRSHKREQFIHKRALLQNVLDTYLAHQGLATTTIAAAANASTGGSGSGGGGWAKGNAQAAKFTSFHVCMCVEDYHTSLIELSQLLEEHIGTMHTVKLELNKKDLNLAIPYYHGLSLAGAYTHFVYVEWPKTVSLEQRKAERKKREDAMKVMKTARQMKNQHNTKQGKRFEISRENNRQQLLLMKELMLKKLKDKKKHMRNQMKYRVMSMIDEHTGDGDGDGDGCNGKVDVVVEVVEDEKTRKVREEKEAEDAAYQLLLAATAAQEYDDQDGSALGHYVTKFIPSVDKLKLFARYGMTTKILPDEVALSTSAHSRSNRRFIVTTVANTLVQDMTDEKLLDVFRTASNVDDNGNVVVPSVELPILYFEDEHERSEPLQSLLTIDVTRSVVSLEERNRIRQEERIKDRSRKLASF